MNNRNKSNWRYLWVLPILMLIVSSIPKILSMEFMVENMEASGAEISLPLLGAIELLCAIIFIIPRTRNIGFLLVTAFLGGVISAEWMAPPHMPITGVILQILLWAGMYFENPDFFKMYQAKPGIAA